MSRSHNHALSPITVLTRTIRSLIILAAELVMGLVLVLAVFLMILHAIFS